MKIGKTGLLLLSVGIPIILLGSLGMARSHQFEEQSQLKEELSIAKQRLAKFRLEKLPSKEGRLEKQLSQTVSQLESAKAALSPPITSIGASDRLFTIAEACGVRLTQISSSGITSGDLKGIKCSVLSLTVTAEGDLPSLVNFITKLNSDLITGLVRSVDISIPEAAGMEKPSAKVQLVLYTYQGE